MAILDIVLLLCFVPAIVSGITKGFIRQAAELVAILVGAWAAFHFSSLASTWLAQYIELDKLVLHIICFVLIVVIVSLLLSLAGILVTKFINIVSLGWINGLLGLLFGIIKVAVILGLLIMAFEALNSSLGLVDAEELDDAVVYQKLKGIAEHVFPYLKTFITGIDG